MTSRFSFFAGAALAFAFTIAPSPPARAQAAADFPKQPIRFIIGPSPDLMARIVGARITEEWHQPVIIDLRPAASGIVASKDVASAAPDGYTWLMSGSSSVVASAFASHPSFDMMKDLAPVNLMTTIPFVLVVNPKLPVHSLKELVALAKAKPGTLNFASPGTGSTPHLIGERLKQVAGIDMVHVPYKGVAAAVTDLIGNQVQLGFIVQQAALPQVQAGTLRAIAVSSGKRSPAAPNIPTVAESGYPGFDLVGWSGLHVPAKTPPAIIAKINAEVNKVLAEPDVRKKLLAAGLQPVSMTPAQFGDFVKRDVERYGEVMKIAHITLD